MNKVNAGDRFGRLIVIERVENNRMGQQGKAKLWKCICDCGKETSAISSELTRPNRGVKSCGCLSIEATKKANTRHGGRNDRLYITWRDMKSRVMNKNHKSYRTHGARGITIFEGWIKDYSAFKSYVSELPGYEFAFIDSYRDKFTLDRIDNNGNYEPGNLRWVDWSGQAANRRTRSNNSLSFSQLNDNI